MKTRNIKSAGFTLIELLVVVAIIGLLSSIILASIATAKKKGQDSKVVQERKSLEIAINLFFNDKGYYPGPTSVAQGALYCLGVNSCTYAGASYASNYSGDFAQLDLEKNLVKEKSPRFSLINKAHAFITNYLPAKVANNPLIMPAGSGLAYAGPFYTCPTVVGGRCRKANLIWTVNKSTCDTGVARFSGTGGSVCERNAAGTSESIY